MAGAAVMGGVWLIVRGGLWWWTWRTSVMLAALSLAILLAALRDVALARHALAMGGSLVVVQQSARDVMVSARTAIFSGFALALAPLLAWIGAITRRANDGETVVGGADIVLWAAMGAWFGLRLVWPVAAAIVVALAVAALVQVAVRAAGWRMPWAADHLPVVPVMFCLLAIAS